MDTKPVWNNKGQPENLLAAAMDAYQWLLIFNIAPDNKYYRRYNRCRDALKKYIQLEDKDNE